MVMAVVRSLMVALLAVAGVKAASAQDYDPENTLLMDLEYGRVVIAMRPDLAPQHVARIKELARAGFYDGLTFHRVIPGFMAQGGSPDGEGRGGSGVNLPAEFSNEPHVRGTVSMARKPGDPDSADSQFFIVIGSAAPHLDGQYTVWGEVIDGLDAVMRLKKGSRANNGIVRDPDKILRMQVAADATD
jgi:peptidylprolyl isomerase